MATLPCLWHKWLGPLYWTLQTEASLLLEMVWKGRHSVSRNPQALKKRWEPTQGGTVAVPKGSLTLEKSLSCRTSSGDCSPGAAVSFRLILPWERHLSGHQAGAAAAASSAGQGGCRLQWAQQLLTQRTGQGVRPGSRGPAEAQSPAHLKLQLPLAVPGLSHGSCSSWSHVLNLSQVQERQSSLQEGASPGGHPVGCGRRPEAPVCKSLQCVGKQREGAGQGCHVLGSERQTQVSAGNSGSER